MNYIIKEVKRWVNYGGFCQSISCLSLSESGVFVRLLTKDLLSVSLMQVSSKRGWVKDDQTRRDTGMVGKEPLSQSKSS